MSAPFDAHIAAAASVAGLELSPAALRRVADQLANLRRLAAAFEAVPLDDDLDPAPVYRPHSSRQA
jgi:hypothetical protein